MDEPEKRELVIISMFDKRIFDYRNHDDHDTAEVFYEAVCVNKFYDFYTSVEIRPCICTG